MYVNNESNKEAIRELKIFQNFVCEQNGNASEQNTWKIASVMLSNFILICISVEA